MSFLSHQIRPGSIRGSVISLVAATIGASTLTIPYIMAITGLVGGIIWIVIGALLTYYAGHLLVILLFYSCQIKCEEITGKSGYERLASKAFNKSKRCKATVSIFMLTSLIGFAVAYMTLIKTLFPSFIEEMMGHDNLPYWLQKNEIGQLVYSTIFTVRI